MSSLFNDAASTYSALSLKDILYARDLFHYHLMCKKNVVATAVGLYRIRRSDPWPTAHHHNHQHKQHSKRTLFNSEVRPYSWPCVYVFVSDWATEKQLAEQNPVDVVPKTLYMPDGRSVPVCVIEAQKQIFSSEGLINPLNLYPRNALVPGVPILNGDAQGMPRLATAGCIVKDGEKFYVLTNKHAAGEQGTEISAFKSYQKLQIGKTASKGITRKLFSEVYPAFASTNQYLQMDMGLIEVEDITDWKTNPMVYGEVENILDLYDNSLTLKLIGQKIVGHGAVSGFMCGEIQGLFYRYKSLGGYEYLCDFLIGPRSDDSSEAKLKKDKVHNIGFKVHHGDSGTLLMIEEELDKPKNKKPKQYKYHPFALLWGKHEFFEDGTRRTQPYALATSLSTALNVLELDFVRDINADNDYTWGYIGHYAIASKLAFTIQLLGSAKLKDFIKKNQRLLAMDDSEIKNVSPSPRVIRKSDDGSYDSKTEYFVPLADVPDNVWKSNVNIYITDGEDSKKVRNAGPGSRGQRDNPNHFADADLQNENGDTLISLSLGNPDQNLTPKAWIAYYDSVAGQLEAWDKIFNPKKTFSIKKHWGALPFRVWQIVDEMIGFAKNKKQEEFLCAGGVLIHYIGDACQPLHSSYLSQGDPEHPVTRELQSGKNEGKTVTELRGAKVHTGYEDEMINENAEAILDALEAKIKSQQADKSEAIMSINSGYDAAVAVMKLIEATQKTLPPSDIVDKWTEVKSLPKAQRVKQMEEAFLDLTVEVMARGARYLAAIWNGAWEKENGDAKIGSGRKLKEEDIKALYDNPLFLPSVPLNAYKLKKDGRLVQ